MIDSQKDELPNGGSSQHASAHEASGPDQQANRSSEGAPAGDNSSTPRPVSADMQQFIGRQLRAVFDDVAKQPVPDRFLELMKQLDSKTHGR
jgi:hypothetical protein